MSTKTKNIGNNQYCLMIFYIKRFFKVPQEIIEDLLYCQSALKTHIKVHQMVFNGFQQKEDTDSLKKKQILDELDNIILEINAELFFLFIRIKNMLDEFTLMLKQSGIPTNIVASNNYAINKLIPMILNTRLEVTPTTATLRNTEDKLIEKYFGVQNDTKPDPVFHMNRMEHENDEETNLNESGAGNSRQNYEKVQLKAKALTEKSSLIAFSTHTGREEIQKSLMQHLWQTISLNLINVNDKPDLANPLKTLTEFYKRKRDEYLVNQRTKKKLKIANCGNRIIKPLKTLSDFYKQKRKQKVMKSTVSKNVKISRMNLKQALKRAQAAVRGPYKNYITMPTSAIATPPPTPPPSSSTPICMVKKITNAKATGNASKVKAKQNLKKEITFSSEEATPERSPRSSCKNLPNEIQETRTKADQYDQKMFLGLFDLFTMEQCSQMSNRRSKRNRRCTKNSNYHYEKIKVKRTAKRTTRRSDDSVSLTTSRSTSSSPDMNQLCNVCSMTGRNMEQCEDCNLLYHNQCYQEVVPMTGDDSTKTLYDVKKCPKCKEKNKKLIEKDFLDTEDLKICDEDPDFKYSKEKDLLASYKTVNSSKSDGSSSDNIRDARDDIIILD